MNPGATTLPVASIVPARRLVRVPRCVGQAQPPLPDLDRARPPGRPGPVDDRAADDPDLRPAHRRVPPAALNGPPAGQPATESGLRRFASRPAAA